MNTRQWLPYTIPAKYGPSKPVTEEPIEPDVLDRFMDRHPVIGISGALGVLVWGLFNSPVDSVPWWAFLGMVALFGLIGLALVVGWLEELLKPYERMLEVVAGVVIGGFILRFLGIL